MLMICDTDLNADDFSPLFAFPSFLLPPFDYSLIPRLNILLSVLFLSVIPFVSCIIIPEKGEGEKREDQSLRWIVRVEHDADENDADAESSWEATTWCAFISIWGMVMNIINQSGVYWTTIISPEKQQEMRDGQEETGSWIQVQYSPPPPILLLQWCSLSPQNYSLWWCHMKFEYNHSSNHLDGK